MWSLTVDLCPLPSSDVRAGILYVLLVLLFTGAIQCDDKRTDHKKTFNIPPSPQGCPYPLLLHERDVIHYVDSQKEFASLGSGAYAEVTLGELRATGTHVVVKSFTDSSSREIAREVRMHRFAEQLGVTSHLIGLLPAGNRSANISLVYEYLPFSKTVHDWLDEPDVFTTVQWVDICRQAALILHVLHENHVLFNDLHRSNILVQNHLDEIIVLYIDFGLATYKKGKSYSLTYGSLKEHKFLAPELISGALTTKASDIFGLGYLFLKVAKQVDLRPLFHLAHWCMAAEASKRPDLIMVMRELNSIIFGLNLRNRDFPIFQRQNVHTLLQANQGIAAHVCETRPSIGTETNKAVDKHICWQCRDESSTEWMWLKDEEEILSELCPVSLYFLDEDDLVQNHPDDLQVLVRSRKDSIKLAKLTLNNRTVVVKDFYDIDFDVIRREACVTAHLAHLDVAPNVFGILIEYKYLSDSAFVQEFYGNGVTVSDFLLYSSVSEWSRKGLEMAAKGQVKEDLSDIEVLEVEGSCTNFGIKQYVMLTQTMIDEVCLVKSHRQRALEKISALIIERLNSVHRAGYLMNNFRLRNILVNWNCTEQQSSDMPIDVRLIDLGHVRPFSTGTRLFRDPEYLSRFDYMAPEVVLGQRSSVWSDIYSLCWASYQLIQDYFDASDAIISMYRQAKCPKHYLLRSCCVGSSNTSLTHKPYNVSQNSDYMAALAYHKYQMLLLHCLDSPSLERPFLQTLARAVRELRNDPRGFDIL